jgi:hypothetical protein
MGTQLYGRGQYGGFWVGAECPYVTECVKCHPTS